MDRHVVDSPRWGTTRIEALSDGVFAIALTLLVLEIKVPELPRDAAASEVWHEIVGHWPIFFSFLITFMLGGAFWFWHHLSFHAIKHVDGPLCAINLVFLMFVSLLPFSTALLGSFNLRQPVSLAFYFGNQLALGLSLNAHWMYAARHGLLRDDPSHHRHRLGLAMQPIGCVLALVMIPLRPRSVFAAFALTQIVGAGVMRRRFGKRVGRSAG